MGDWEIGELVRKMGVAAGKEGYLTNGQIPTV